MWHVINIFLIGLTTISVMLIFGRLVLNKKNDISKLKIMLIIMLIALIYTIIYINFQGVSKTIAMFLIDIISYSYIFKISIKKSIFLTLLYMILLLIPELIELYILINILGLSREFCYETYAGSLISNFFIWLLFIIITYIFRKPLRKLLNYKIENDKQIIIFSILIFLCTGMFFYTLIKELRFSNNILLYLIAMAVLMSALISLIKQVIINKKITNEYDKILEFMTTYEEEIEKQRILNHETKNEFLAIRAKMGDHEDEKEIIKYIDEILKDKIIIKQEAYAKFGYLPPNGIKGLCYLKVQAAEKKGLNVGLVISKRIKDSTIFNLDIKKQREFAKIIGVFLDNAIEASASSEKKQIGIEAYITNDKEFKMVISNTFNNEINTDKIGKERFSTKGKKRGHGLLLVNHIMKNNNQFKIEKEIIDGIYSQTIIVRKINKV